MYITHCKLSSYKQIKLLEHFVAGTPTRTAVDLVGIHRNSAIRFFLKLRCTIFTIQQERVAQFCGKAEVDESYFGGVRKGKRGRGAVGKGLSWAFSNEKKVYAIPGADTKRDALIPVIREKIKPDSVIYTDGYTAYNALDVSEFLHYRINHSKECYFA